jgi:hypothetical protein
MDQIFCWLYFTTQLCKLDVILGFHRNPCNAEGFWVFQQQTALVLMTMFRGPYSALSSVRWNEKLWSPIHKVVQI